MRALRSSLKWVGFAVAGLAAVLVIVLVILHVSGRQTAAPPLTKTTAALAQKVRPKSYTRSYHVNPAGGNGVYKTINDAITALKADNLKKYGDRYGPWPGRRFAIYIDPGVYDETINTTGSTSLPTERVPEFTDFIGTGRSPSDVVMRWAATGVQGQAIGSASWKGDVCVLALSGTGYIANLTLYSTGHGVRTGVHAFPVSQGLKCVICERVHFVSDVVATNGPNALDCVVGSDSAQLFIGCDFSQPSDPGGMTQAIQCSMSPVPRTALGYATFIDCTASAPDCIPSVVNFNDQVADGVAGEYIAWIGGSITQGRSKFSINIANKAEHHSAMFIVDPSISGVMTPTVPASLVRATTFPGPIPLDGVTPAVTAYVERAAGAR